MSRQNRRERFWITPQALARRAEGRMPESTTWVCVSDEPRIAIPWYVFGRHMEIKGEYQIANNREDVWKALIDPEMLKKCIPGCESVERISDTEFAATVMAAIGPVRARFNTKLSLENLRPPHSYTLVGESKAGAAGFGRGSADVTLTGNDDGTLLSYTADFKVGGKLAQVGSRLVLGVTKKTADDFFGKFSRELDPGAASVAADDSDQGSVATRTWLAIAGAVVVLLIWWFLLR